MGCLGSTDGKYRPQARSAEVRFSDDVDGAPEWFIDAPNGGNGSGPGRAKRRPRSRPRSPPTRPRSARWSAAPTCTTSSPPDGKNWDGIQYYDPAAGKGVVYLFKPAPAADTMVVKLRGVEPGKTYRVTFEDGASPAVKGVRESIKGLKITLRLPVSELVFLDGK